MSPCIASHFPPPLKAGGGASATLGNAFRMSLGSLFHFKADLVASSTLGYHTPSTLYLQYSNTGELAIPAPILRVTISQKHADGTTDENALLTLDPSIATQGLWTSTVPAGAAPSDSGDRPRGRGHGHAGRMPDLQRAADRGAILRRLT